MKWGALRSQGCCPTKALIASTIPCNLVACRSLAVGFIPDLLFCTNKQAKHNRPHFPYWSPLLQLLKFTPWLQLPLDFDHDPPFGSTAGPQATTVSRSHQPRLHCLFGTDKTNTSKSGVTPRDRSQVLQTHDHLQPGMDCVENPKLTAAHSRVEGNKQSKGGGRGAFLARATRPAFFGLLGIVCSRHLSGSHLRVPRNDIWLAGICIQPENQP